MEISILCKVVDNFGDIGVAYRMARRFFELDSEIKVNLIVDGLNSFCKIEERIDEKKSFQILDGIFIYNWNDFDFCYRTFSVDDGKKLSLIIELFQCGRPEWMEKILFEDKLNRTVHILMVDYLTAEQYAEDFHKLQSLTRSAKVQKINFMPGFTSKTGGLIIENNWKEVPVRNKNGPILFFTYQKNWDGIAQSVTDFLEKRKIDFSSENYPEKNISECCDGKEKYIFGEKKVFCEKLNRDLNGNLNKKLNKNLNGNCVLAAGGAGFDSVKKSFKKYIGKSEFSFIELPFCNQLQWDEILKFSSFLFIRGEESLSRACLSGIPFVWHAYVQSQEYQIVKVNALLQVMEKYFLPEDFLIVKKLWLLVNICFEENEFQGDNDRQIEIECKNESEYQEKLKNACNEFLQNGEKIAEGFRKFAKDLRKNGDLCFNVMTFIKKNYIIQ